MPQGIVGGEGGLCSKVVLMETVGVMLKGIFDGGGC